MSSVDRSFARDVGLQTLPAARREEGRLTRSQEGAAGTTSVSQPWSVTAAAPEDLGLADVRILVTATSSRHCKDSSATRLVSVSLFFVVCVCVCVCVCVSQCVFLPCFILTPCLLIVFPLIIIIIKIIFRAPIYRTRWERKGALQ